MWLSSLGETFVSQPDVKALGGSVLAWADSSKWADGVRLMALAAALGCWGDRPIGADVSAKGGLAAHAMQVRESMVDRVLTYKCSSSTPLLVAGD